MIDHIFKPGLRNLAWGGILMLTYLLSGCQFGSDASPPLILSGVAATGKPIVGASVTVRAGDGTQASATTDANGAYSLALTTLGSPPYLIELAGGKVGSADNPAKYHSLATASGTANISPITEMIVLASLNINNSPELAMRFGSYKASDAKLISDGLAAAKATVAAALLADYGISLGGADPLTVGFAANGTSDFDQLLGKLARGSLITNPPLQVATLDAATFKSMLDNGSPGLTQVVGNPKCSISVYYMKYNTIGGANEATNASGTIMVPSGTDPACTGARPVVLYAHGTTVEKSYNLADLNNGEAALVAASFAAQGFIVVASNYAGYDTSTLTYHPYLNAEQQAADMIDALRAARKAFTSLSASASSKLFISGYSQGGHVAMATHKAMLSSSYSAEFQPTALGGMSGPYALSLFGDAIFAGRPNAGGTIFTPMVVNSWQKSYGGLYSALSDIYESQWATGIDTLIPGPYTFTTLITQGKLPQLAYFAADSLPAAAPGFEAFFGAGNLVKSSFRNAYLADAAANPCNDANNLPIACTPGNAFRKGGVKNDLRSYVPTTPVLLCGGKNDPTVFYPVNTQTTQAYFLGKGMPAAALTVVDVDSTPSGSSDPFAAAKVGFALAKAATEASGGNTVAGRAQAVAGAYHGGLVPPFCSAVVQGFFKTLL